MTSADPPDVEHVALTDLADEVRRLADTGRDDGRRLLLGLCGPPGTGKSTIAKALAAEIGAERVSVVQLDGYHLASNIIAGTEMAERRGAIDTFDADSFAVLVERLRAQDEPVVYAPTFERDIEEPINASLAVRTQQDIVVVEGNYLLADGRAWERVRACLDEVWYLHTEPELRVRRLVDRHVESGKDRDHATDWVRRSDEANATLVQSTRHRADRVLVITTEVHAATVQ